MVRLCLITCSLVVCCGLFSALPAQDLPHFIEKLTTSEGLGSNAINDLAQDSNGFLWIATSDGLNRFDGTAVVHYYHHPERNSLPHNYVYCLKSLPGDWLAIGTQAGLGFYNQATGVFRNFYYQRDGYTNEPDNSILELELDAAGNLWAASNTCIFIFDSRLKLKEVLLSPFKETDVKRGRLLFVRKILPLSDGNVLLYLFNGPRLWSKDKNELTDIPPALLGQLPADPGRIFTISGKYFLKIPSDTDSLVLFDEQGRISGSCYSPFNKYPYISWSQQVVRTDSSTLLVVFHNYGLAVLSLDWRGNKPVPSRLSSLQFGNTEYRTALQDRQGNLWLATTREGLQKISPGKQYFTAGPLLVHDRGKNGQAHPARSDMMACIRQEHTLWVATYGEGFIETDLLSGRQQDHHLNPSDLYADFVWNIRPVTPDTFWIGTQRGLFWYSLSSHRCGRIPAWPGKPSALDSVSITTQFIDSRGLVWMGLGLGRGVCAFDTLHRCFTYYPPGKLPGTYPFRYPINIAEDGQGDLWFANDAASPLVRRDHITGHFETIPLPFAAQKQLGSLNCLCIEGDSIFWLGSIMCGLIKFNPRTGFLKVYGHENGLGNSHINYMYEDEKKRIWLVTDACLSMFDQVTETFTNYTPKDGLPATYPTASFYYDTGTKRLFTGGQGKFFWFEPGRIPSPGESVSKTLITAMQVNDKLYLPLGQRTVVFNPQQNDITIQYTAVDLTDGPSTRYMYQLKGIDTGWINAGTQRQLNFSHLAPGSYTFQVRTACRPGIKQAQAASISFRIRSPFTQTAWFYALLFLAAGGVFYAFYSYRARQLNRTRQVRSEISRNLHDEVGAGLTNISLSCLLAQKQLTGAELAGGGASAGGGEPAGHPINRLLERIYQDSQTVSESMREIIWSIDPRIETLGEALPRMVRYASELLEASGMELQPEIASGVEKLKLTMKQRRNLYLIFKEAINNMARHSKASRALIRFHLLKDSLQMIIADNGAGFDEKALRVQNGLKNMQERAREQGWQLEIRSCLGQGTTITLNTT